MNTCHTNGKNLTMFHSHMSYTELSKALYSSYKNQSLLSEYQLKQIRSSLKNTFLETILSHYPLAKNIQKLIKDSMEAAALQDAHHPTDLDVHSVVYGGRREITLQYLSNNYPPEGSTEVIRKIKNFLTNVLKEPDLQHQLLIAETARYKIREKLHRQEILSTLEPLCSIDDIIADFKDYLEYLNDQKNNASTYAWDVLESIFQRQQRLTTVKELDESYALLLFALDDSRTAYHDKHYQFVRGKNYTCQRGLLERLLDHHQSIVPEQAFKSDGLSELISTLIRPFVLQDYECQEEGCRQTCSQYLYQLYLKVAGYGVREKLINCYAFKADIDTSTLKKKYEQSLYSQSNIHKKQALFEWDLTVAQIKRESLVANSSGYAKIILFLNQNNALKIVVKIHKELSKTGRLKSEQEIVTGMLNQGPFIDKAHLELVLSLHDPLGTIATLSQIAEMGTEVEENFISPSRTDMILAYQKYLEQSEGAFYPFLHEEGFRQRLQDCLELHTIGCSQTALCEWLERETTVLRQDQAEKLACLCAQAGYAIALNTFCQKYSVSPNHIDVQQRKSLLYIAAQEGHVTVVAVLIKAGADVDLLSRDDSSALILASDNGYAAGVDILIQAGADVNLQNKAGNTALRLAVRAENLYIVKMLLRAGANPDLKNKSGSSAVTVSIANNKYRELLRGGQFAIDIAIQAREISSLNKLIDPEKVPVYYIIESVKKYINNRHYHWSIEILLQENIAQCIVRNKHQIAPMAWAARHGCIEALRAFDKAGASLEEADEFGETALMYVQERNNIELKEALQQIQIKKEQLATVLKKRQGKAKTLVQRKENLLSRLNISYNFATDSELSSINSYYKALLKNQKLLNAQYQIIYNRSTLSVLMTAARQYLTLQESVNFLQPPTEQQKASMTQLTCVQDVCEIKKPYLGQINILGQKFIPCFAKLPDKKIATIIFSARDNIDATINSYKKGVRQSVSLHNRATAS